MWVGAVTGLYRYRDGIWTHYTEQDGLSHAYVQAILEAPDGTLWLGTNGGGVVRFRDGHFSALTTEHGLSSNLVRSLYMDADGILWIGTENRGLNRVDLGEHSSLETARVTVYSRRDGLFDDVIHQILEDDFSRLWMSTNRGIFWVHRETLNAFAAGTVDRVHSTSYTSNDGMRNSEANGGSQPAGIKARDGRLWFPTQDGAVVVDPARIRRNDVPPRVVIEDVTANDSLFHPRDGIVRLPLGRRDLEISYTALSFQAPENMRFRYRLEPYGRDWVEAGNRRVAYFTNVPPDTYTFRVIASNNDGVWNTTGASVRLLVPARFYETSWFAVLGLFLVVILGLGLYYLRVRLLLRQREELHRLVEERTAEVERREALLKAQNVRLEAQAKQLATLDESKSRFFANVTHEFRTPLTLVIGPLEDVRAGLYGALSEEVHSQIELALRNARRLLRLVDQVLDVSKLQTGELRLRARESDLRRFVRAVATVFAPLAERKRLTFRLDDPDDPLPVYFDPDLLEKALTNLLSNAFKFTPEQGVIRVTVRRAAEGAFAEIVVRDNGPGIPANELVHLFDRFHLVDESQHRMQPGAGIGLSLTKDLIELHGGHLSVESEEGFGTTFAVRLPLGRAHLDDDQLAEGTWHSFPRSAVNAVLVETERDDTDGPAQSTPDGESPSRHEEDVTTVLVVDDNASVRAYIRSHLVSSYRVVEAADGEQGLETVRRILPDLVIADVMMPGMSGYAL